MGVIYDAQDDVNELLIPFINSVNEEVDRVEITSLYMRASLGKLGADDFWHQVGLDPSFEDDFLASHTLNEGTLDFLKFAHECSIDVWCLSNDVSRWSMKLRELFALDEYFVDFVISGDIGHRKPSVQTFQILLERTNRMPELFVDDRIRNVEAALSVGIPSVCFRVGGDGDNVVSSFDALKRLLSAHSITK